MSAGSSSLPPHQRQRDGAEHVVGDAAIVQPVGQALLGRETLVSRQHGQKVNQHDGDDVGQQRGRYLWLRG